MSNEEIYFSLAVIVPSVGAISWSLWDYVRELRKFDADPQPATDFEEFYCRWSGWFDLCSRMRWFR